LVSNLLRKSIENNDFELCSTILNNVQILEEDLAVDCIKYFLTDLSKNNEESVVGNVYADSESEKKL
jgi:hypothetical protein